jgi:hypothetical protein
VNLSLDRVLPRLLPIWAVAFVAGVVLAVVH